MDSIKETREIILFQSLRNSLVESKYIKKKTFSVVKYIRFNGGGRSGVSGGNNFDWRRRSRNNKYRGRKAVVEFWWKDG